MSDNNKILGKWFAARENTPHAAELQVWNDKCSVLLSDADNEVAAKCASDDVEISARIGNIPRRLEFGDLGTFETLDNDGVDRSFASTNKRSAWFSLHALEEFRPRLIAFVAAAIVLLIGLYRFGVPALVEVAIWATPPAVPALMSEGTLKTLDTTLFDESALPEERLEEFRQKFAPLAEASSLDPSQFNLQFRSSERIGPNAFALPDGTIIVTDQMINFVDNDEIVLGVLAHEIGHVELKHSLRQLYRTASVVGLGMLIAGDIGPVVEDVLVQGTLLVQLSYSREAEAEADQRSVEIMHAAGKDPAAVATFFEKIGKLTGETSREDSYFSTHPSSIGRQEDIRAYAKEISGQ